MFRQFIQGAIHEDSILLLVVIGIVGLVFYLGWLRVSANSSDGKANVTITVDKDKIEADQNKTQEKIKTWDSR